MVVADVESVTVQSATPFTTLETSPLLASSISLARSSILKLAGLVGGPPEVISSCPSSVPTRAQELDLASNVLKDIGS
eukprot:CAMPEP_0197638478 /NCGR_PEP_ID=MMETSP1338-20131121/13399_1 /TAXON_ID=43686 ORGANISM="Pelagodinium beii, Strain RCC1491" /NCGR_SAMPLE_ID=MMETSP1338 /ASSEMBLY_ACC=CAM_ASM_000754 /LENGTH=77 /DNA_ID=CAMNT_0043211067 /DNA_START=155 /DNA_END=388 /DNA_ORIENTATION=+